MGTARESSVPDAKMKGVVRFHRSDSELQSVHST